MFQFFSPLCPFVLTYQLLIFSILQICLIIHLSSRYLFQLPYRYLPPLIWLRIPCEYLGLPPPEVMRLELQAGHSIPSLRMRRILPVTPKFIFKSLCPRFGTSHSPSAFFSRYTQENIWCIPVNFSKVKCRTSAHTFWVSTLSLKPSVKLPENIF
jgi:hypothetical protein